MTTSFDPANTNTNNTLSNQGNALTSSSTGGAIYFGAQISRIVLDRKILFSGNGIVPGYFDFGIGDASVALTSARVMIRAAVFPANGLGLLFNNIYTGTTPSTSASNHLFGIAIDIDAQLFWFRDVTSNPATWNAGGTANPATGVGGISFSSLSSPIYAAASIFSDATHAACTVNFWRHEFYRCGASRFPENVFIDWYTASPVFARLGLVAYCCRFL